MFKLFTILVIASPVLVMAQQPGTVTPEKHLPLPWSKCTSDGHCTQVHGEIVLDAGRWLYNADKKSCYDGKQWNATSCPDDKTCAQNCALNGISQPEELYGVTTNGHTVKQIFINNASIGSKFFLLENETIYQQFYLLNQEFTFDVDVSSLHCGMNAALYLVSMEADGGIAKHPTNKAGAKYGTGYCDAQCPRYMQFINGEANIGEKRGACCAEMDLWEANSMATQFTPHPCTTPASMCTGDACPIRDPHSGPCDPEGCGFNSYAMGNHTFYGPGMTVDTNKVFTVVTQFITNDNTANGDLHEIRRFYVQGGKVIPNSVSTVAGIPGNSLTQELCIPTSKRAAGGKDSFTQHGGLYMMGEAMRAGMTLTWSLWDDRDYGLGGMAWLDADNNGPCPNNPKNYLELESKYPHAYVTYANIKVGPINSTFAHA